MEPVVVKIPPSIVRMHSSDKTYAISGDTWLEVPHGTTFAQLPQYMVFQGYESTPPPDSSSWTVEGSKGNAYIVKVSNEGVWTCTCPGYGFRRRCKHIDNVKAGQKEV